MVKFYIEADTTRQQSPILFIGGILLFILRLTAYMSLQENYYFKPQSSHMSYPFSFIAC